MRLKAFRVRMYRPILDSAWVDIDDISVIVGKNESGKTAMLKALHKFKPFKPEPYTLEREWPRGHRRERSLDAVVVQTRFVFENGETEAIANFFPGEEKPTGIEISKTYKGEYRYILLPKWGDEE
jgi:AAA15 family ATPase/GTPase